MAKNKNRVVIMLVIALLLLSIYFIINSKTDPGLKIHYYKDGVEVFPQKFLTVTKIDLSIYDEIALEIVGENTGDYPISNLQVVDANPIQFKNAIPSLSKTLEKGEIKTLWISDRMKIREIMGEDIEVTINFWINISGESQYLQEPIIEYQNLYIEFSIPPLIVDGNTIVLGGDQEYGYVEVKNGGVIEIDSSIGYLNLVAIKNITIDSSSKIDGNGKSNYTLGGNGGTGGFSGGSTCVYGYGGAGGSGAVQIGSETSRTDFSQGYGAGNGGCGADQYYNCDIGNAGTPGGNGGSGIRLYSDIIVIKGLINVDGSRGGNGGKGQTAIGYFYGTNGGGGGGGGGSAGTILIDGINVDISESTLSVVGGGGGSGGPHGDGYYCLDGYDGAGGAGGKGGRVKIFYKTLDNSLININLGNGGTTYYQQI